MSSVTTNIKQLSTGLLWFVPCTRVRGHTAGDSRLTVLRPTAGQLDDHWILLFGDSNTDFKSSEPLKTLVMLGCVIRSPLHLNHAGHRKERLRLHRQA